MICTSYLMLNFSKTDQHVTASWLEKESSTTRLWIIAFSELLPTKARYSAPASERVWRIHCSCSQRRDRNTEVPLSYQLVERNPSKKLLTRTCPVFKLWNFFFSLMFLLFIMLFTRLVLVVSVIINLSQLSFMYYYYFYFFQC